MYFLQLQCCAKNESFANVEFLWFNASCCIKCNTYYPLKLFALPTLRTKMLYDYFKTIKKDNLPMIDHISLWHGQLKRRTHGHEMK